MSCIRWWLVLLGLGLGAADLRAQVFLGPGPYFGGRSFTYARFGRYGGLSFSAGGFASRAYSYGVILPGYVPPPPPPVVTVVYTPPPPPPQIVVVSPTRILVDGLPLDIMPRNGREMPPPDNAPERLPPPPLPGENAGAFRPLDPGNRARARRPLPPEQPPPPPPPKKPAPPKPPVKPKEPPRPPRRPEEPKPENVRLIDLGRRAFAALEYGRAAQRFRQATQVVPADPTAYFLLAQTLFALGKYDGAVAAIHAGMERDPNWPKARFRPLELYGPNVADYAEQLRRLDDVRKRHPNDPVLLFLSAHQLWFDGRKEEARPLFRRARAGLAHPADADRFLRALPAPAVL